MVLKVKYCTKLTKSTGIFSQSAIFKNRNYFLKIQVIAVRKGFPLLSECVVGSEDVEG